MLENVMQINGNLVIKHMQQTLKFYQLLCLLLLLHVNAHAVTLKVGETYTCTLSNVPSYLQGCQWTSSRPNDVAIISSVSTYTTSVTVKALRSFSGSPCIIHCQYYYLELDPTTGRYTYLRSGFQDWNFFVHDVEPTDIRLDRSNISLDVGQGATIVATMSPSSAVSELTWRTSSSNVASVTGIDVTQAKITARGTGSCVITVTTSNGLSASCNVSVNPVDPTGIAVSPTSIELLAGTSKTISYTLYPSGASGNVTWDSMDDSIASVSQEGKVTGLMSGQTIVSATTSNGYSADVSVTVLASVETISLNNIDVYEGYSIKMIPIIKPENISTQLTWTSSNSDIATVSNMGVVSAKKSGSSIIYVKTDNGKTAQAKVTVHKPQEEINARNAKQRINILEKALGKIR